MLTRSPVDVAGITVKNQYFSPVTTLSSTFDEDPIDGILGLAYPSISNLNKVCDFPLCCYNTLSLSTP